MSRTGRATPRAMKMLANSDTTTPSSAISASRLCSRRNGSSAVFTGSCSTATTLAFAGVGSAIARVIASSL